MLLNLPKIIGHRGVKDLAPENTMPSLKKAASYNIKCIEVDVKVSKDNIPFLLHDNLLDRTTSGKGLPYDYTYEEIKNLDAGSWFNKSYRDVYPPSLEEVLKFCNKNKIGLNIELKPNKGREIQNINSIYLLLNKLKLNSQYFFSSFDYKSLKLMRKKIPYAFLSYLVDSLEEKNNIYKIINDCLNLQCFSIGFNIRLFKKDFFTICKDNDLKVTIYSNSHIKYKTALKLWDLGVDSIFVDNPIIYKKELNI